jgi:2-iminobutanoate/2-iminopropanoate deaminase
MTSMHRFVVSGPDLPAPASPISHAVVAGDHCYVSGQLAVDASGVFRSGTACAEADLAFRNVFTALAAAGFSREEVVFVEIAFQNLADLPKVNTLFAELFATGRRPARTVYEAAALPYGGKIKVQAVAVRLLRSDVQGTQAVGNNEQARAHVSGHGHP